MKKVSFNCLLPNRAVTARQRNEYRVSGVVHGLTSLSPGSRLKDTMVSMGQPSALACSRCNKTYAPDQPLNLCECGAPLLVRYDLAAIRASWRKEQLAQSVTSMWRYAPVLPADVNQAVTLNEGWTPLIHATSLGRELGASDLWIKDEGRNPTDSFKARGLSCAVTMAKKLGLRKLAIPSAGNAASALAAYAAAAGIESHIFMPRDVPQANFIECKAFGAHVTLVDGLISDCGRIVGERKAAEGWFEVSTLKEPYRIEGKKTMGYEVAEQFGWEVPDAILYPCGGGVGLIGMWKAFAELEELGWIGSKRPKMISVQALGCEPITRAFEQKAEVSQFFNNAHTVASGLRVPKALGDFLVLQAVRESAGTALSISDEEMLDAGVTLAEREGIFAAPEGGACVAAVRTLLKSGFLKSSERIVIYNTGSGLKYLEAYSTRFPRYAATQQDMLGGLITPR
jgi:threonine synthase